MPRYHEQFGRPLNADPGTRGVVESPTRGSSTKDLWAAFLGGITLIVVSALGACIATRSRCTAPSGAACEREAAPPDDLSASYEVCAEEVSVWPCR